jgi:hypothetical protein
MDKSICYKCGETVYSDKISEGKAIFRCRCGKKWTTPAYYGKEKSKTSGGAIVSGAAMGGLVGGVPGAIIGGIVGGLLGTSEITSECLRCGGIGRPTGSNSGITMFQCENCKRTWTKRR